MNSFRCGLTESRSRTRSRASGSPRSSTARSPKGRSVRVEGMLSRHGKPFDATLQVNAEKRGIEFIFKNSLSNKERVKLPEKEAPAVRQAENKPQKRGLGR